jgi:hypothetical protein
LKRSELRNELEKLCIEAGVDKRVTIFLDNGGISYVLETIVAKIYFSGKEISKDIRIKLTIFHIIHKEFNSIFYYNECIEKENEWGKTYYIKEKEEKRKNINTKIEEFLKEISEKE